MSITVCLRNAFNRYIEELAEVSVDDIQRVAQRYIRPDDLHVMMSAAAKRWLTSWQNWVNTPKSISPFHVGR